MGLVRVDAGRVTNELTRRQLVRAVVAATVGTGIEFYDISVFGTLAGLYINKVFFPQFDVVAGTLAAFFTFGLGFVVRPIGALLFGHFGDRIGRKAALIATLLLMGVTTFLMGLVPTYAQIGIWGAVILSVLRIIQGLALGGEWGGSVLLTAEWGNRSNRGLWCAFPNLGIVIGNGLGYVAVIASQALITDPYWVWRVPLLVSLVLVLVGLYVRLGVLETPAFARLLEERRAERYPSLAVAWQNKRDWITVWMMRAGDPSTSTIINAFVVSYATTLLLHMPQRLILNVLIVCAAVSVVATPYFGYLSDRLGRRFVYGLGGALIAAWAFPYWWLLGTKDPVLVLLASLVAWLGWDVLVGAQAALFAETFTRRRRYSGASFGYQMGGFTWAAPATFIATSLVSHFRENSATPLAVYMMAGGLISLVATFFIPNRQHHDLSVEYDEDLDTGVEPVSASAG
jgi:MFS family permease